MKRRKLLTRALTVLGVGTFGSILYSKANDHKPSTKSNDGAAKSITMSDLKHLERNPSKVTPIELSDSDWDRVLSESAYSILREEGTERPGSSPLNNEKRKGQYVCAGCGLALFESKTKYESGTGWPSFYQPIEGRLGTKTDFKIGYPRKEYHCSRCKGHQGHVFKDGPQPTGLRYCNNGLALNFIPGNA